jgi:thiamine-monophosphate kinase
LSAVREQDLLQHIYERSADLTGAGDVIVGPGDDAAVIRVGDQQLILTVDQLVAGRHYEESTPLDLVARKSIARSVSDIAAMGGRSTHALATGCLPPGFTQADHLFDRMASWARHFGCPLIGGDIAAAPGPLMLTVTVLGTCHPTRGPVLRSGARPGDTLCVTGRLGGAIESGHHLRFDPRIDEAGALCDALDGNLGALMDVSDGLGIDAGRIASASSVRLEINAVRIPLREGVTDWRRAASDGEDYELLFTVRDPSALASLRLPHATSITVIGRAVAGEGCVITDETGAAHDASSLGWDHTL